MSLKQKAIAYFKKKPEAPASAFAKLHGVSTSYAHKLKALAIDWIAEDYNTQPDVIIERGWQVESSLVKDTEVLTAPTNALNVQVAGSHYKGKAIQPVEYIHANNLGFLEGCIVKRITRWRDKPAKSRFEDLEKIKHEVDLLIEMEQKYGKEKL